MFTLDSVNVAKLKNKAEWAITKEYDSEYSPLNVVRSATIIFNSHHQLLSLLLGALLASIIPVAFSNLLSRFLTFRLVLSHFLLSFGWVLEWKKSARSLTAI